MPAFHNDPLAQSMLTFMISVSLVLSFVMLGSHWLRNHVYAFALESWVIALISAAVGYYGHFGQLYAIAVLTALFRGTLLPHLLLRMAGRLGSDREFNALFRPASSLLAGALLLAAAFVVSTALANSLGLEHTVTTITLTATFGLLFIGLLMMILRTEALSHILGLLVMENGIFLGTQVLAPGFPFLLEVVILFDLLIIVMTFGLLGQYLKTHAGSTSSKDLQKLVG